ncbi:hypothetical protein FRIGORI9N_70080 [Frigoribacterium sp. 9N]|nr:hypothetical protein FRIGORI9N_70080 [Frigoribacterium sp. 9N]
MPREPLHQFRMSSIRISVFSNDCGSDGELVHCSYAG